MLARLKGILNFNQGGFLRTDDLWNAIFQAVDRLWSPPFPQKVLEIGCESTQFLRWLDETGHSVQRIDLSETPIRTISDRLPKGVAVWQVKPEKLPFGSKSFDTVFFTLSLEYTSSPKEALKEAFRVAKSSVIIVSFNFYSPYLWVARLSGWMTKSSSAGCRIISSNTLTNMIRSVTEVPLRITSEPVRWKDMGTTFFSPIIVTRFDIAYRRTNLLELPVSIPASQQFVPSPSSYEKFRSVL